MELKTDNNCYLRTEYITTSINFIVAKLKILHEQFSNSNNYDCDDILIKEIKKLIDFAGEKIEVYNKMQTEMEEEEEEEEKEKLIYSYMSKSEKIFQLLDNFSFYQLNTNYYEFIKFYDEGTHENYLKEKCGKFRNNICSWFLGLDNGN